VHGEQGTRPSGGLGREPLLVALVLLVILVGAALLIGSSEEGGGPTDATGSVDGMVIAAEQGRVVFRPSRPFEGRRQLAFEVRPQDAASVDVQHLKLHSAQGLGTRLYYERDDDRLFAVGQEDLPGT
jgi:hypothetical protein